MGRRLKQIVFPQKIEDRLLKSLRVIGVHRMSCPGDRLKSSAWNLTAHFPGNRFAHDPAFLSPDHEGGTADVLQAGTEVIEVKAGKDFPVKLVA